MSCIVNIVYTLFWGVLSERSIYVLCITQIYCCAQQHKHAEFWEPNTSRGGREMASQHHLVNTHLSTTLTILGEGGGGNWGLVGWCRWPVFPHGPSSLWHTAKPRGGSNTKLPLINKATALQDLIVFLCKHPESLSFNYIKKAKD